MNLVSKLSERLEGDRPVVNVLSSFVTSNETHSLDVGVVADCIYCGNASMDNVEDTRWQTYEKN